MEELTGRIISFFGTKFTELKEKSNYYLKASFERINGLDSELESLKNKQGKQSERTRISLESEGS